MRGSSKPPRIGCGAKNGRTGHEYAVVATWGAADAPVARPRTIAATTTIALTRIPCMAPMLGTRATEGLSARYRPLVLDFRILGPLEVVADDGPVRLGGKRPRATLPLLLWSATRVVPTERIPDDLYAGPPPVTAVTQVQRQISELRKLLGSESLIETRSPGYIISVESERIDLKR